MKNNQPNGSVMGQRTLRKFIAGLVGGAGAWPSLARRQFTPGRRPRPGRGANMLLACACALLGVSLLGSPARSQNFFDVTFNNSDWGSFTTIINTSTSPATFNSAQNSGDGVAAPSRKTDHLNYTNGTVGLAHLNAQANYDQTAQNKKITSVTYTFDLIHYTPTRIASFPFSSQAVAYYILLVQGGTRYWGPQELTWTDTWAQVGKTNLVATDFSKVLGEAAGAPDHPDFSCTAKPIQLGYVTLNHNPLSVSVSRESAIDNWKVDLTTEDCKPPPPPPNPTCLQPTAQVKCNPGGAITVTVNAPGSSGSDIIVTSQTPGVTVTPAQQPWSATTTWTLTGATAGQSVTLSVNTTTAGGGSVPGTDLCCSGEVTVVVPDCPKEVGSLIVEKEVVNNTPMPLPNLQFPVTVTCGAPASTVTNLTLTPGIPQTLSNIPVGSICTVDEPMSTLPAVSANCGQGKSAVWAPPYVPASVQVSTGAPATIKVTNTLSCNTGVDVSLAKIGETTPSQCTNGWQFTLSPKNESTSSVFNANGIITITDTVPPNMRFDTISPSTEWQCPAAPLQAGQVMTCTYVGSGPTATNQAMGTIVIGVVSTLPPPYTQDVTNCADMAIIAASGKTDDNNANNLNRCATLKKLQVCRQRIVATCDPETTRLDDGRCVCRYPNMTRVLPEKCACPQGQTLVPGRGCVPQTACTPPMIQGPIPGSCVCPQGTVQQGRECVPRTACTPPMVEGPMPGVCVCPSGTVQRGRECVRPRECRAPLVLNTAGTDCVCREGLVRRGQRCVPALQCRSPLIANASGTQCVCPAGMVRKGRECVRPIMCVAPAKPNQAGTACVCPRGMVARGNACAERERLTPRDIFRNIPGRGPDTPGGPRPGGQGRTESPGRR